MTREMIDVEKPRACVRDRHPSHPQPDTVQFLCYSQWDHSEIDHPIPFMVHFQFIDGRVSAISYN
jgi:hypothetical protein